MANSVPTLTGLTTPVTFLENAAPQIIAADVTFTDPDNNFNAGRLTVTGLLAQDTVAIRNQGTGAGRSASPAATSRSAAASSAASPAAPAARSPSPSTRRRRRRGSRR